MTWLESGPGAEPPGRGHPPASGRWVVCGYGRFGRELVADLRSEGLDLTVIDPNPDPSDPSIVVGDGSEPNVMARADLEHAVGFVAATDNDTTNLSLIAAAARVNPRLCVAGRQNEPANAPLFGTMPIDSLLVPTEVVAHEVYAQLSAPLLWRFLQQMPAQGNAWAATMIERLTAQCGRRLHDLWKIRVSSSEAPALVRQLAAGTVVLGHLLRDPDDRDRRLEAVPLLLHRHDEWLLAPTEDIELAVDDEVLFAGQPSARRELETIAVVDAAAELVITGRHVPASWIWRRLTTRSVAARR